MTKLYSKSGDKGKTRLANGKQTSKSTLQVKAYGEVDELNSYLGLLKDLIKKEAKLEKFSNISSTIFEIQNHLYFLGSELAGLPLKSLPQLILQKQITFIELSIDEIDSKLPVLKNFIVPGGCLLNSYSHVARTVCRRSERSVVELSENQTIREECIIYLNRLSDWLFVLARFLSFALGCKETIVNS